MDKVFLAGATGMVGSNILQYMVDNDLLTNTQIIAVQHDSYPFIFHKNINYIYGNLTDLDGCRELIKGCDIAILAAAHSGGAQFIKAYPWAHMKTNLIMNLQLLEACKLEGVKKIIFIGSSTIYPEFEGGIKEDFDFNLDPNQAYYGYGWAMRFIEKMCRFLHEKHSIEVVIVRAANIYGPYDKFDPDLSHVVPALIKKAVDKMNPFEVWGSPSVTRDILYSEDFARAIVALIRASIKFDIFNIGSEQHTSVYDMLNIIFKHTDYHPEIKYLQDKPTTIKFRALDCSKIKALISWKPEHTVEAGIKTTIDWWMKNKETWNR